VQDRQDDATPTQIRHGRRADDAPTTRTARSRDLGKTVAATASWSRSLALQRVMLALRLESAFARQYADATLAVDADDIRVGSP
jgi:hypothetical protein